MISLKNHLSETVVYLLQALLLVIVLFWVSACVPMPGVDDEFDYNPSKKRELSELKKSYALLGRMEEIEVALHLSKKDFLRLANGTFKDFSGHFVALDAGEFSHVAFGAMKFHLSNQQLVSQTAFSLRVEGLQREIFGYLMAMHTLEAASDRFILNTEFDEIIVEGTDGTEAVDQKNENVKLIEKAARSFMHTLNTEIKHSPLSIPVDLNILSGINGKEILAAEDYKLHSSKRIHMSTKMRTYLPYICKRGITFLGSSKIKYAEEPLEDETDIAKMSHRLRSRIDAGLYRSMDISLEELQEESSYYVSKSYLSEQMNASLRNMDLRMIKKFFLKLPEDKLNLSQEIYLSGKAELPSCQGIAKQCREGASLCNRNCSEHHGSDKCTRCDTINNPFEKVRCMSDLEACRSKEDLLLYSCLKEEERCRLASSKAEEQCIRENTERVILCEKKKKNAFFINDKMALAKLKLRFDVANSYAIQRIHSISFGKDLSTLEVQRNLHVSVDSSLTLGLKGSGTADVNCTLLKGEPRFVHSYADRTNILQQLPLCMETLSDGALIIKAKSRKKVMPIVLKNSPYESLHASKADMFSCRYQNMPLKQITVEENLLSEGIEGQTHLLFGEIELAFEEEELRFKVSPAKIGTDLSLYPGIQEKSIGFTAQSLFE